MTVTDIPPAGYRRRCAHCGIRAAVYPGTYGPLCEPCLSDDVCLSGEISPELSAMDPVPAV